MYVTAGAAKRLLRRRIVSETVNRIGAHRVITQMRLLKRDDHEWSQAHLSHYAEGDLSRRARRRLELHAEDCPDCSRGIRALRALLRLMHGAADRSGVRAPESIYDRVRAAANEGAAGAGPPREE